MSEPGTTRTGEPAEVADPGAGRRPGNRASAEVRVPASAEQVEVWLACQREPESGRYNLPIDLEFVSSVAAAALRAALADVLRAHPALRSSFRTESGELIRVVEPDPPLAFIEDRRAGGYDRAQARRWAATMAGAPFDLAVAPLVRAALLVRDGGALLVVTVHHAVSDGRAAEILTRDLVAAYQARLDGRAPDLAVPAAMVPATVMPATVVPAAMVPATVVPATGAPADPDQDAADERYWTEVLRAAPAPLAPIPDLVAPDGQLGESGHVRLALGVDLVTGVRALARAEGASPGAGPAGRLVGAAAGLERSPGRHVRHRLRRPAGRGRRRGARPAQPGAADALHAGPGPAVPRGARGAARPAAGHARALDDPVGGAAADPPGQRGRPGGRAHGFPARRGAGRPVAGRGGHDPAGGARRRQHQVRVLAGGGRGPGHHAGVGGLRHHPLPGGLGPAVRRAVPLAAGRRAGRPR